MKLNPWLTEALYQDAVKKLEYHLASSSLIQINEEKYGYLRDGIPISVKKPDGKPEIRRVRVFDFDDPLNNHFLAIKELKIHGELYRRRTDIVGFVNGIPLLFVELKNFNVDVQDAYTCNYTDYLDTVPHLFYYNAFLILSNGEEAKVGTLGSKYAFFHEWKRLKEDEEGSVALETMLRGICNKRNLMDLFENFILFDHSGGHTAKILARNHQYLGVNEAVEVYKQRKLRDGKLGVFWHTQGSGKSYSMLFLAQKIRRKFDGSPTFVVLTDREELNTQISDTFENCGMPGNVKASKYIAQSGEDLIHKLKSNPSFIFTLIQKFNQKGLPPITPNYDIIIMSDEAHRSQNGDMVIVLDRSNFPDSYLKGSGRQWQKERLFFLKHSCTAALFLLEWFMVEVVQLVPYCLIQFRKRKELTVPQSGKDPSGYDTNRTFHRRFILGSAGTGRQNSRAVMLRHLPVDLVNNSLILGVLNYTGFEIIRHQKPGYAARMLIRLDMGIDPGFLLHVQESLCVSIATVWQYGIVL